MRLELAPGLVVTQGPTGWRIWVAGEPGSGKSWCSFGIALQVLAAGGQVVVLDTHGDYGPIVTAGDVAAVGYEDGVTPQAELIPAYMEAVSAGASITFDLSVWATDNPSALDRFVAALLRGLNRTQRRRGRGRVMLIAEEAQNICPQSKAAGQTDQVRVFTTIAIEGRKFGLDFLLTAQRPSLVDKSAITACNIRVFLRHSDWEEWVRIRSYGLERFCDYEAMRHFADGQAVVLTNHQDRLCRLTRPMIVPGPLPAGWAALSAGSSARALESAIRAHPAERPPETQPADVIPIRARR